MQKKLSDKIVKAFKAELKNRCGTLLESLMWEERTMSLKTHPTSANGYCIWDLLTPAGLWRISKFPACGKAISIPRFFLIRKRTSLQLSEAILHHYAVDVSTLKISAFLEGIYGFWPP